MRKTGKKRDSLAILLVILLVLSLAAAGLSAYFDRVSHNRLSSDEALQRLMDELEAAANIGGAPAIEDFC